MLCSNFSIFFGILGSHREHELRSNAHCVRVRMHCVSTTFFLWYLKMVSCKLELSWVCVAVIHLAIINNVSLHHKKSPRENSNSSPLFALWLKFKHFSSAGYEQLAMICKLCRYDDQGLPQRDHSEEWPTMLSRETKLQVFATFMAGCLLWTFPMAQTNHPNQLTTCDQLATPHHG